MCNCIHVNGNCWKFLQGNIQLIVKWEEYILSANKLSNNYIQENKVICQVS